MIPLVLAAGCGPPEPLPELCDAFPPAQNADSLIDRPNILLVIMDDVGVELIGSYGDPNAAPTPTIDGLAAEGVRFTEMTSEPWCSPTRAELATGRYAYRYEIGRAIELESETTSLPLHTTTIAEVLEAQGWTTAVHGKWHLTALSEDALNGPALHGFRHHDGTVGNLTARVAYDGAPQSYTDWENVVNGTVTRSDTYITTHTFRALETWTRETPEPWFAWVGLHAAHTPWHLPPDHRPEDTVGTGTPAEVRAMVTDLDRQLGALLDKMDPVLRDRTVIIVVGDNGSTDNSAMGPYVGTPMKSHVTEGGIHVPLVIAGPIVNAPGRTSANLATLPDLFATLADIADAPVEDIDGTSLVPVLTETGTTGREWSFATAFQPNGAGPYTKFEQTIRGPRFKLIRDREGDTLYDLSLASLEGEESRVQTPAREPVWETYREILDQCFPPDDRATSSVRREE